MPTGVEAGFIENSNYMKAVINENPNYIIRRVISTSHLFFIYFLLLVEFHVDSF